MDSVEDLWTHERRMDAGNPKFIPHQTTRVKRIREESMDVRMLQMRR